MGVIPWTGLYKASYKGEKIHGNPQSCRWCGGAFGAVSQTAQAGNNAVITYRSNFSTKTKCTLKRPKKWVKIVKINLFSRKPFRVYIHRRDEGHNHDATRIRKGFKIDFRQLMCGSK